MKENDEIRITNAELLTNVECRSALSCERGALAHTEFAKVERVVLNALQKIAALPPDIRAFGDQIPIVFREADPPWAACRCLGLHHLVIPSSLDIRHSSLSREMSVPRVDEELRYLRQAMIA
jgi:hypothetical protein